MGRRRAEPTGQQARRDGTWVGVLLQDLDHFEAVDDRSGRQTGDHVLRQVAGRLSLATRPPDVLARFGGEELVLVAPGATGTALRDLAERLRAAVGAEPGLLPDGTTHGLTVSIGTASPLADAAKPGTLLQLAYRALYAAKERGRDQVVHHQAGPVRLGGAPGQERTASPTR